LQDRSDRQLIAAVPAAGIGSRFGGELPKQFLEIAGRPLLAWTLDRLLACEIEVLVVAIEDRLLSHVKKIRPEDSRVHWIAGGKSRQESVENCLKRYPGSPHDMILVHDGARPAVARADVRATLAAALESDGAVLGRQVADTIKQVERGKIISTVDRTKLFRAETPQAFRRDLLERAIENSRQKGVVGTDEASIVELLPGVQISAVEATQPNPKLTEPADFAHIEWLLAQPEMQSN
jgi:2-C-methyl-D-erythritol 4-phosphate cytidylyltransferase